MKTLIVADVHLKVDGGGERTRREFVAFLRDIDPAEFQQVIILGDLFDFWFEYRHVIFSGYFDVLRALAELRDAGLTLHLVCGNHDFWAGRFLRDEIGIQIHYTSMRQKLGPYDTLFLHGDGVNPRDAGYRLFKRVARARIVVATFRLLHPDWAMGIAQRISHGSRTYLGAKDPSTSAETEAIRAHARKILGEGGADAVISAHSHYAVDETCPAPNGTGRYINTGDWMAERRYVVWDGAQFHMMQANAESGTVVTAGSTTS